MSARRPTRLRRPPLYRRYHMFRVDWIGVAAVAVVAAVVLVCWYVGATLTERDKAEQAAKLMQFKLWHQESALIHMLAGEPLVDRDTRMVFVSRIGSYP